MIQVKRVYEKPSRADGLRILVDRLSPRGLTKERAALKLWQKGRAWSTEVRKWFGHDRAKWKRFQIRCRKELREKKDTPKLLRQKSKEHTFTLPIGGRDELHNDARVLKKLLTADDDAYSADRLWFRFAYIVETFKFFRATQQGSDVGACRSPCKWETGARLKFRIQRRICDQRQRLGNRWRRCHLASTQCLTALLINPQLAVAYWCVEHNLVRPEREMLPHLIGYVRSSTGDRQHISLTPKRGLQ